LSRRKGFFSNFKSNFYHLYHHTNYFPKEHLFTACHDHWILLSKPQRFGFKARGLRDTWHRLLVFRIYSKSKQGRFKTNVTHSLILRFNLRLGGYSMWSAIFYRTPYQRSNRRRTSRRSFKRSRRLLRKYSRSLQYSAMKSTGACQTQDYGTVCIT
jgi:hypothetical protein